MNTPTDDTTTTEFETASAEIRRQLSANLISDGTAIQRLVELVQNNPDAWFVRGAYDAIASSIYVRTWS